MSIIFSLVILYFSYKQPARYIKEPTKKNMTWCAVLGVLNVIFVVHGITLLGEIDGLSLFLGLFEIALHG